jgi:hypothetical protein
MIVPVFWGMSGWYSANLIAAALAAYASEARVQARAPNCLFAALLPLLESMDKRCQKVGVAKSAVLSGGFADL